MDLKEYLATAGAPEFHPVPVLNATGEMISWYWSDAPSYSEPIHHDGRWVGSVHREMEDGRPSGVSIHLEAVVGLKNWFPNKGSDLDGD